MDINKVTVDNGDEYVLFNPKITIAEHVFFMCQNSLFNLIIRFEHKVDDVFYKISFYHEFKFIRKLSIGHRHFELSGIEAFSNLETLYLVDEGRDGINFEWFPKLKFLSYVHRKAAINLNKLKLMSECFISNYNKIDLQDMNDMRFLKELTIRKSTLESLDGLNSKVLENLDLYSCHKLHNIDALRNITSLKNIDINSCKRIEKLDALENCTMLEELILLNCGEIESFSPLLVL